MREEEEGRFKDASGNTGQYPIVQLAPIIPPPCGNHGYRY